MTNSSSSLPSKIRSPSKQALERELASRSLYEFCKQAWDVIVPTPYVDGKHVEAVCKALESCLSRDIQNLVINIPPGHAKSLIVSTFFPAWAWARNPRERFLCGSHSIGLAERDSVMCRDLIRSPWYQSRWGDVFQISDDQDQKRRFKNNQGGERVVCSVGSKATGESAEIVLIDDPHNTNDVSATSLKTAIDWYRSLFNRVRNPKTGVRVVIGQRVHEEDLSGFVLGTGLYKHLCLPAEYIANAETAYGLADWRTEEGELLWPQMYPKEALDDLKTTYGLQPYAALYQQRPVPPGGMMVKTEWIHYYTSLPEKFDQEIQSWDLTFTASKTSDYVVGQVWARRGADCYLIDQVKGRWDFPEQIKQIKALAARYPQTLTKLVENKANGAAAIATLKSHIQGLTPVNPTKDKEARLNAVLPLFESGNVYLPANAPWIEEYVIELTSFPKVKHDDCVDATSQALSRLSESKPTNSFAEYSY